MKTLQDLKPLRLYSAADKLYIPTNLENKRKGSAILLLSNDPNTSIDLINSKGIINNNLYRSYYTNKDVEAIINHEGTIIGTTEDIIDESAKGNILYSSPEELQRWMINNIKYKEFTKLMSHDEVLSTKSGSCHDQVIFEIEEFKKMKIKYNTLFLIEYTEENTNDHSNITHSLLYYELNNSIYWFENAWRDQAGIHKFNSVKELKEKIINLHQTGHFGNYKKFPKLKITHFKNIDTGSSLQDIVDKNLNNISESYLDSKDVKFKYLTGSPDSIKEVSKILTVGTVLEMQRFLNNVIKMDNKTIEVFIYSNYPTHKDKMNNGSNKINTIHIISPSAYKNKEGNNNYSNYVKKELATVLLKNINSNINKQLAKAISIIMTNQVKKFNEDNSNIDNAAIVINNFIKKEGNQKLIEVIRKNNTTPIDKYAANILLKRAMNIFTEDYIEYDSYIIFENSLSTEERNTLKDSDFGIPSLRKYPLNDESHVRSAVKFFNDVDKEYEEELANNIKKKIKIFNLDIKVGENNRLSKYI